MKRKFIKSTTVLTVGYDSESKTLEVQFTGGKIYQYYDVPPQMYELLLQAESSGEFLNKVIKKQKYKFKQIR